MEIRDIEKTGYFGYLFFISYNGTEFVSFDELLDKGVSVGKSVKGTFKKLLEKNNISYYKGIQQGGRTDRDVSANENILYINSKNSLNIESLKIKSFDGLEIKNIKKTFPYLVLPDLIQKRHYIYKYPKEKIKHTPDEINKRCEELTGTYDVSPFTDKKGSKLLEKVREIMVYYKDDELHFIGSSFMPKQVRIMSGYILNGEKKPLEGVYLTLDKMELSEKLEELIITEDSSIHEENVEKVEKNKEIMFFYVKKSKKGELIGKNGKNIKALRKKYGNIVIKETES